MKVAIDELRQSRYDSAMALINVRRAYTANKQRYALEYRNSHFRPCSDDMKARFIPLELGFNKGVGEGCGDSGQIGIATAILCSVVITGGLLGHVDVTLIYYEVVVRIVNETGTQMALNAGSRWIYAASKRVKVESEKRT